MWTVCAERSAAMVLVQVLTSTPWRRFQAGVQGGAERMGGGPRSLAAGIALRSSSSVFPRKSVHLSALTVPDWTADTQPRRMASRTWEVLARVFHLRWLCGLERLTAPFWPALTHLRNGGESLVHRVVWRIQCGAGPGKGQKCSVTRSFHT